MNQDSMENQYELSQDPGCPAVGIQNVNICVPITVKPFGEAGNATVQCLGCPIVMPGCDHCPGKPGDVCKFTISQKLRIEVPVVFGARAQAGEASIECGCSGIGNSPCLSAEPQPQE